MQWCTLVLFVRISCVLSDLILDFIRFVWFPDVPCVISHDVMEMLTPFLGPCTPDVPSFTFSWQVGVPQGSEGTKMRLHIMIVFQLWMRSTLPQQFSHNSFLRCSLPVFLSFFFSLPVSLLSSFFLPFSIFFLFKLWMRYPGCSTLPQQALHFRLVDGYFVSFAFRLFEKVIVWPKMTDKKISRVLKHCRFGWSPLRFFVVMLLIMAPLAEPLRARRNEHDEKATTEASQETQTCCRIWWSCPCNENGKVERWSTVGDWSKTSQ